MKNNKINMLLWNSPFTSQLEVHTTKSVKYSWGDLLLKKKIGKALTLLYEKCSSHLQPKYLLLGAIL